MSMWMFLKIAGDGFLYFSVICAFPFLFNCGFSCFWPPVLCGAGVGMAALLDRMGRRELRVLGLVLPLCSLILTGSKADILILTPLLLYTAAVILRGEFSLEYYSFRQIFLTCIKVWAIFFLVILTAHNFETEVQSRDIILDSAAAFRYGLLWALCGVLLQRQLRLGDDRPQRTPGQSVALAVGSGAVLAGFVALERLLMSYATSIDQILGQTMKWLVSLPIGIIGAIIEAIMRADPELIEWFEEDVTEATAETIQSGNIPMATPVEPQVQTPAEETFPWWLVIVILVVMSVILIYMMRVLRSSKPRKERENTIEKVEPAKRSKRESSRSNRTRVRRAYRAYLKAQRKKGLQLRTDQTSLDILNMTSQNREPAARLREVYLAARYDETRPVTAEQVRSAQETLKEL